MTNTSTRPETMVERVARAICASAYDNTPASAPALRSDFIGLNWRNHILNALAAMQEISDPTDVMVSRGSTYGLSADETKALFRDMITEAIWSSVKSMITAAPGRKA